MSEKGVLQPTKGALLSFLLCLAASVRLREESGKTNAEPFCEALSLHVTSTSRALRGELSEDDLDCLYQLHDFFVELVESRDYQNVVPLIPPNAEE